jgi:uncharacterized protein YndB with AHSA1/START domain
MSMQATETAARTSVMVEASLDRAFRVFTTDLGSWWPEGHHILEGELAETVFEPRIGGRVYDRMTDGRECAWARVLTYEPPRRFVISWDIGLDWEIERDPERVSEVEVRFLEEAPARTRVELEHRNLERHGAGWEEMRASVAAPNGWSGLLQHFADAAAA